MALFVLGLYVMKPSIFLSEHLEWNTFQDRLTGPNAFPSLAVVSLISSKVVRRRDRGRQSSMSSRDSVIANIFPVILRVNSANCQLPITIKTVNKLLSKTKTKTKRSNEKD